VDAGTGFGIILGARGTRGAVELSYQRSSHDTSSFFTVPGESTATYNVIDLNAKIDVFAQDQLRPYVLLGFGFPWLTIEESATDGFSYYDETFHGFAFNVGAGAAYYLHPQWALTGGLIYRWSWFWSVEDYDIDDDLSANTLGLTFGITYTF
jgi:opacity protein-like surface antigen